jgi:pyruvate/2-oxoglutarate dehydrogenase complex dihydrolipoamide acyltransferase (E2) component
VPALSMLVNPRKHARHAKPSRTAPVLAAGGLAAVLAVADATVAATSASAGGSVAQFERLAQCESGGNWSINTGNGYYGGLQFNLATWRGLGLGGYPHQASKAQQIAAGQKLHSQRGWQPWPACSRKLGLRGDGGYSGSGAPVAAPKPAPKPVAAAAKPAPKPAATPPVRASRSGRSAAPAPVVAATKVVRQAAPRTRAARVAQMRSLRPTAAPRFDGRVLTTRDARTFRPAVKQWQTRMAARGWSIRADGLFGPRSAAVAAAFARDKGVRTTAPGTVDRALWDAAWTTPVTP